MKKFFLSRGVLLINLGTPNKPTPKSVRKYLKEFLFDKRIIDIFWVFRLLLLYLIILPIRSKKSAKLYQNIWTKDGSPLLLWAQKNKLQLQQALGEEYHVVIAMRYGSPSIAEGIAELNSKNITDITIVPMFPQYAAGTTGSVIEKVSQELNKQWHIPPYQFVKPFFENEFFIKAQATQLQNVLNTHKPDFVLFSYHGLPVRHLQKSKKNYAQSSCLTTQKCCDTYTLNNHFCYKAQCHQTTRLIADACNLSSSTYATSFQSRFGKGEWTSPDTQQILKDLRQKNIRNLAVACPAFVADCLETLEEINIRLKEDWQKLGGSKLVLVPSLNDNQDWINCLKEIVCNLQNTPK